MVGGAAGHDLDLVDAADLVIAHAQLLDDDVAVLNAGGQRVADGSRLLENFL